MLKKIPVCFTLKPKNVKLLKNAAGIATASAFLDCMIEIILGPNYGGKWNYKAIFDKIAAGDYAPATLDHPTTTSGVSD